MARELGSELCKYKYNNNSNRGSKIKPGLPVFIEKPIVYKHSFKIVFADVKWRRSTRRKGRVWYWPMATDIGRIKETLMEVRLGDAARKMVAVEVWNVKRRRSIITPPDPAKNEAAKVVSVFKLINHFRVEQANVEIEMEHHLSGVPQPEASKNKYVQLNLRLHRILPVYTNVDFLRGIALVDFLRGIAHNLEL